MQAAVAGRAGIDALRAAADVYRRYALEHPGVYASFQRAPAAGDEEWEQAGASVVDVVLAVLRGYELEGDAAIHAARILRASLHGFASLEAGGGFAIPLDLDESFARLVDVVHAGLAAQRPS
jgi:hypothetical protein